MIHTVLELLYTRGYRIPHFYLSTLKKLGETGLLVFLITIISKGELQGIYPCTLLFYMLHLFLTMSTLRISNTEYYRIYVFGSLASESIGRRELNFYHEFSPTKDILHYKNIFWTSKAIRSFSFPYYYN